VTVAEILKGQGYTTAAFFSAYVLDKQFGLDQGFDVYDDDLSQGTKKRFYYKERRADAVTKAAIQWFKKTNPQRFFLWIHYFDPHKDYRPPPPFFKIYADNPYDGEIAYTDHWVGMLLETLYESGKTENTLIMVMGDHGEGLGEHKEKDHGIFIYDATLKIPLIISCPKPFPASKRISPLVRLIDIAPTILDMAGCTIPNTIQGVSLFPLMRDKLDDPGLILFCESYYPQFSHN
jgi:arylsulfatase A-like enzyme